MGRLVFLIASMILGIGCYKKAAVDPEEEGDPADADTDVECMGDGVWYDSEGALCWQDPPSDDPPHPAGFNWPEAVDYCAGLALAGYGDWRLPTVDELRSLLRPGDGNPFETGEPDCSSNLPAGECEVNDPGCLSWDPCQNKCGRCAVDEGPGREGCYWDPELQGRCGWYWSSSCKTDSTNAWYLGFRSGSVENFSKAACQLVRCVRSDQ